MVFNLAFSARFPHVRQSALLAVVVAVPDLVGRLLITHLLLSTMLFLLQRQVVTLVFILPMRVRPFFT